jgi:hypothetical protein
VVSAFLTLAEEPCTERSRTLGRDAVTSVRSFRSGSGTSGRLTANVEPSGAVRAIRDKIRARAGVGQETGPDEVLTDSVPNQAPLNLRKQANLRRLTDEPGSKIAHTVAAGAISSTRWPRVRSSRIILRARTFFTSALTEGPRSSYHTTDAGSSGAIDTAGG